MLMETYRFALKCLLKLAGMKPQLIETEPGTSLHFWVPTQTRTASTKPAVVFLHGFGLEGILSWQFQVMSLARSYDVYVPDFLFFGGSTTDKMDRLPEFQARCVARSLEKLGVEKCVVVGWSYGGMVGFKLAEMFPDLVKSMVVTCSVMALTESVSSDGLNRIGFSSWSDLLIPRTIEDVRKTFKVATYRLPWLPDFFYNSLLKIMSENRKERVELLDALITKDKDFYIPHFRQTINLLWGENDRIFDMEVAQNLREQLKGKATLQSIEKAGHLVAVERPFAYNKLLKSILSSIPAD